jgi:carbamoyl-phosphate synthase large subunit
VVFPSRDGELKFWAKYELDFRKRGINIIISPLDGVELCLDKLAFARFGLRGQMPFIPADIEPFRDCPNVVKERYGAGGRAMGLNLSYDEACAHAFGLAHPIFQPIMAGQEISVDAWCTQDAMVHGIVLRRRDMVKNGESVITTTFRHFELEVLLSNIIRKLRLRGPVVLQAIIDEKGSIHVIECNARFGGASTCSIAVGLDSFYWTLQELRGSVSPFCRLQKEVRQIRVMGDIHVFDSSF